MYVVCAAACPAVAPMSSAIAAIETIPLTTRLPFRTGGRCPRNAGPSLVGADLRPTSALGQRLGRARAAAHSGRDSIDPIGVVADGRDAECAVRDTAAVSTIPFQTD